MMRLPSICLSALAAGAIASCGNGGGQGTSSTSAAGVAPLSQRLNQDQGYTRDADGNWIPRSDQRSEFDRRMANGVDGRSPFANRKFRANHYQAPEWTRPQSSAPQAYQGDTDGSRFRTTADAQGRKARQARERARIPGDVPTGTYATGSSREANARRFDRPQDTHTQNRRDLLDAPVITDWRQQRDLTIDQSRSILAR